MKQRVRIIEFKKALEEIGIDGVEHDTIGIALSEPYAYANGITRGSTKVEIGTNEYLIPTEWLIYLGPELKVGWECEYLNFNDEWRVGTLMSIEDDVATVEVGTSQYRAAIKYVRSFEGARNIFDNSIV